MVHFGIPPLNYHFFKFFQAINSPEACKKRLFKYVVPVVFISILVNLPKFFESYVEERKIPLLPIGYYLGENGTVYANGTLLENFTVDDVEFEYSYYIQVSDLRKNPHYTTYYTNWTRFFILGIIPTILLIYFNYKVSYFKYFCISKTRLIARACIFM